MENFKVRIWHGKTQQMIYPGECFEWTLSLDGEVFRGTDPSIKDKEDCEIMLFSGLCDIEGIEIYEGDIVSVYWGEGEGSGKSTMKFKDGGFIFRAGPWSEVFILCKENIKDFRIKVIDNIYEKAKRKSVKHAKLQLTTT